MASSYTPRGPDRVHVPPVGLGLGVHLGIAVDLGGRGQEESRAFGLGQTERIVGAERADLEGLDRELEVVDRAGRRGEVQDAVERPIQRNELGDVVLDEGPPRL